MKFSKANYLCLASISFLLLATCKKNSSSTDLELQKLQSKVIAYLKPIKNSDSLIRELDLSTLKNDRIFNEDVLTVRLRSQSDVRKIVFFQNQEVISRAVINTVESAKGINYADEHFADIVSHRQQDFTGTVSLLNIHSRLTTASVYKDGKFSYSRKLVAKPKDKSITGNGPLDNATTCTMWYWVDEYPDGSEVWTYMYTTCDDGGGGGGGGGGSGSTAQDDCANAAYQAADEMSSSSSTSSQIIGMGVTDIDALTKNVNPTWVCLTNLTWNLVSQEAGTVKLTNAATNRWEWQTLTHVGITKTGGSVGGTVTTDSGTGTPSFTPGTTGILVAGMSVHFNVTYAPAGAHCPVLDIIIQPYTIPYTAGCFFNAAP